MKDITVTEVQCPRCRLLLFTINYDGCWSCDLFVTCRDGQHSIVRPPIELLVPILRNK
jgi:hypothetical protein